MIALYNKPTEDIWQMILIVLMVIFYILFIKIFLNKEYSGKQKDVLFVFGAIQIGVTASVIKAPYAIFSLNVAASIAFLIVPMYMAYLLTKDQKKE
ncbi:hypothetical protein [Suttonella ornithocola]|uniref:Uncharacterized protein n=1 Tax=Suttonella ornithocola TaxID=279832 RepID=A0A380MZS4_9GAMM|nr:hypothetical protein [Suttonella ornithocola]SUO97181.1 Uncharacterised protein [Suttonella ornithocola]